MRQRRQLFAQLPLDNRRQNQKAGDRVEDHRERDALKPFSLPKLLSLRWGGFLFPGHSVEVNGGR